MCGWAKTKTQYRYSAAATAVRLQFTNPKSQNWDFWPSGKEPVNILGEEALFKEGMKVIGRTICLSHSKQASHVSSVPAERVSKSAKLPIGAGGAVAS